MTTKAAEAPPKRKPIGKVRAVVEFNIFEGDELGDGSFPWFEYACPGIQGNHLAVCTRPCKTISAEVIKENP